MVQVNVIYLTEFGAPWHISQLLSVRRFLA